MTTKTEIKSKAGEIEAALAEYCSSLEAGNRSPKTIIWYLEILREYFKFLRDQNIVLLAEMGVRELNPYILYLKNRSRWEGNRNIRDNGKRVSPHTVQAHVRAIKAFWGWLLKYRYITDNPLKGFPLPKVPEQVVRIITPKQFDKLLTAIDKSKPIGFRNFCMLLLYYDTGMRLSEGIGIEIDNIDFTERVIRIFGKGQRERYVPVARETMKEVRCYIRDFRDQLTLPCSRYLFARSDGQPLSKSCVQQFIRRLKKKAGLEDIKLSAHILRHSSATQSLMNNAKLVEVQAILGHKSPVTTYKYIHLLPKELRKRHDGFSPIRNLKAYKNRR